MNDYWNDPPEPQEPPECCDEYMDVDESGRCICKTCGKVIEPEIDIDLSCLEELPDNPAC